MPAQQLGLFAAALARVQALPLVGVVERYDESMVLLESLLQPYFPGLDLAWLPQNVTRQATDNDGAAEVAATLAELGPLAQTVIDNNSYDFALYRAAEARLQFAIAQVDDFAIRFADFRRRCAQLGPTG